MDPTGKVIGRAVPFTPDSQYNTDSKICTPLFSEYLDAVVAMLQKLSELGLLRRKLASTIGHGSSTAILVNATCWRGVTTLGDTAINDAIALAHTPQAKIWQVRAGSLQRRC